MKTKLMDEFFAGVCCLCCEPSHSDLDFCLGCLRDLPLNNPRCGRCAMPLETASSVPQICGQCLKHPPDYQQLFAPYRYAVPCDYLVTRCKFSAKLNYAWLIGRLLAGCLTGDQTRGVDLILPVPLHPDRRRERGFNQAEIIARAIAAEHNVTLGQNHLHRARATPPQSGLGARQRRANVRGAFSLVRAGALSGKRVAVVDDVVTTASTVSEVTALLLKQGAASVVVWAFARVASQETARTPPSTVEGVVQHDTDKNR